MARGTWPEEADGTLVGRAVTGPHRTGGEDGGSGFGPRRGPPRADVELYALHVPPERVGTGVGRDLTAHCARQAAVRGRARPLLRVAWDTARARWFHARAGCAPDGAEAAFTAGGVVPPVLRSARVLPPPAQGSGRTAPGP